MASASDLTSAAAQSFTNLFPLWSGGNNLLKAALTGFASAALPIFPESDTVGRPLGNWGIVLSALAFQLPSVAIQVPPIVVPYIQLLQAVDYVYRICWLAAGDVSVFNVATPPPPQITNAQRVALLAAYNANF